LAARAIIAMQVLLESLILASDVATLGSFVVLCHKLRQTSTCAGISLQTVLCLALTRALHATSHWMGMHYRPRSLPDFPYKAMDYLNAVVSLGVVVYAVTSFGPSYEAQKDSFGGKLLAKVGLMDLDMKPRNPVQQGSKWGFLYVIIVVLSFAWYSVRPGTYAFNTGMFCCVYEVMTAIALLPQLWMFWTDKKVSSALANFVALTALNRFFTLSFWVLIPWAFPWATPSNRTNQMISEAGNLLILADFMYYYIQARLQGKTEIVLPSHSDEV